MTPQLTIYKASAGSGKTFKLAVEFITLLVREPEDYQRILAVTFTNKATEEMKMRIISQLYGIARGLASSDGYLAEVRRNTGLTDITIRNNAQLALSLLIHNYNYFRVQTIDAFFQGVLRNLARELGLTANLRVGLNDVEVLEKAIDGMIDSLKLGQNELRWISEYIDDNTSEDKSWNVINQLKDFGKNIFKDEYKEHRKEMDHLFDADEKETDSEKAFFRRYIRELRQLQKDTQKLLL